jgi:hypothetical protein
MREDSIIGSSRAMALIIGETETNMRGNLKTTNSMEEEPTFTTWRVTSCNMKESLGVGSSKGKEFWNGGMERSMRGALPMIFNMDLELSLLPMEKSFSKEDGRMVNRFNKVKVSLIWFTQV